MPRTMLTVALAAAVFGSTNLAAQIAARADELQPGARVRVTAPGVVAARYVGTVLSRNGDTLTLGSPNTMPLAIPTTRIVSLEVSRGKSRSDGAIHGMKWGTPIGLGFGLLTMGVVSDCLGCVKAENTSEGRAVWVGMSALSGLGYGALIGALIARERWEPFQLTPRTAFRAGPDGASLGLRFEF